MFFDFINAWTESGFELWVSPEGVPGAEIGFNNNFGDVPVKAFADAIVVNEGDVLIDTGNLSQPTPTFPPFEYPHPIVPPSPVAFSEFTIA